MVAYRSLDSGFASGRCSTHNGKVQVERLAPRTLGLIGPVLVDDADRLLDAIASLAPGRPITLDLTEVTSIDEGGVVAIRRAATKAHDIGGSWSFSFLHPTRSTGSEIVVWTKNR